MQTNSMQTLHMQALRFGLAVHDGTDLCKKTKQRAATVQSIVANLEDYSMQFKIQ